MTAPAVVDPAAIGQLCAVSNVAKFCGDDGLAYRGVCAYEGPDGGPATAPMTAVARRCHLGCAPWAPTCSASQRCEDNACW